MKKTSRSRSPFLAGIVGNVLEWYDFALYGHFSVLISRHFFPEGDRILATFAVFSVSFFMRPIGAILFSAIGDRHGRRKALSLSILGMAVPTAGIGLLPGYSDIGLAATLILILLRLLQGVALGGEMGGAVTFVMEHTPKNRIGHASSWIQASTCLGLLAGTLIAGLLAGVLEKTAFEDWGWRIPFILGVVAAWLGFLIRRGMAESVLFEIARNENRLQKNPLGELRGNYWKQTLTGIAVIAPMTCGFFFCFVYFNSFLITAGGLESAKALLITSAGLTLSLAATLISGKIADRIGYRPILLITGTLMVFVSIPLTGMMGGVWAPSPGAGILAYFTLSVLLGAYCSTAFASVTGLFPTPIRYSGISVAVNLASPIFGSTVPLLVTAVLESKGQSGAFMAFGIYFTLLWVLALIAIGRMCPQAFSRWGHPESSESQTLLPQ